MVIPSYPRPERPYIVQLGMAVVLVVAENVTTAAANAQQWWRKEYEPSGEVYASDPNDVRNVMELELWLSMQMEDRTLTGIYLTEAQYLQPITQSATAAAARTMIEKRAVNYQEKYIAALAELERVNRRTKKEAAEFRKSVKTPKPKKGKRGQKRSAESIAKYKATMAAKRNEAAGISAPTIDPLPAPAGIPVNAEGQLA